jgi:hypothetical protein
LTEASGSHGEDSAAVNRQHQHIFVAKLSWTRGSQALKLGRDDRSLLPFLIVSRCQNEFALDSRASASSWVPPMGANPLLWRMTLYN